MEGYKEAYGVLGDPLADTVAGALLGACDQSRVVDDAVEYLALRRFGGTQAAIVRPGPWRECVAAHGRRAAGVANSEVCSARGKGCMRVVNLYKNGWVTTGSKRAFVGRQDNPSARGCWFRGAFCLRDYGAEAERGQVSGACRGRARG